MGMFGKSGPSRITVGIPRPAISPLTPWNFGTGNLHSDFSQLALRHGGSQKLKQAFDEWWAIEVGPKRRGPKRKPDYQYFKTQFEADARELLEGRDPIGLVSNYSLAKAQADCEKPHNRSSVLSRLIKYLGKNREAQIRLSVFLVGATDYPVAAYRAALESKLFDVEGDVLADLMRGRFEGTLAKYQDAFGEVPEALPLAALEAQLARYIPPSPPMVTDKGVGGFLAGLLSPPAIASPNEPED